MQYVQYAERAAAVLVRTKSLPNRWLISACPRPSCEMCAACLCAAPSCPTPPARP